MSLVGVLLVLGLFHELFYAGMVELGYLLLVGDHELLVFLLGREVPLSLLPLLVVPDVAQNVHQLLGVHVHDLLFQELVVYLLAPLGVFEVLEKSNDLLDVVYLLTDHGVL